MDSPQDLRERQRTQDFEAAGNLYPWLPTGKMRAQVHTHKNYNSNSKDIQ